MKIKPFTISLLVLAALVLLYGVFGFYQVEQGEEALVLTFGEITGSATPGIHWRLPLIQTVEKQSITRITALEYGFRTSQEGNPSHASNYMDIADEAIVLTGDGNLVSVEAVYQISIRDTASYLYNCDDPLATLHLAFETVLRRNLQGMTIDEALLKKEDIENLVLPDIRKLVNTYQMGVDVRLVKIQNIQVPNEVRSAYEDVNNAKNDKARQLDEADRYEAKRSAEARSRAYELVAEAEGYKAETIAQAQGDVALFGSVYEKYKANKLITRQRLMIETMETILAASKSKYIVDDQNGILKFLPLNESADSEVVQQEVPVQPTPQPTPQQTEVPQQ